MSSGNAENAIVKAIRTILELKAVNKAMGLSGVDDFKDHGIYGVKMSDRDDCDDSHCSQFKYEAINFRFCQELNKLLTAGEINAWSDTVTTLFGKVHHSAYINSEEFVRMFTELMRHRGVPSFQKGRYAHPLPKSVADKACKAIEKIRKNEEPEDSSGYNPELPDIAQMTRDAGNWGGKKSNPFNGIEPINRNNKDKPTIKNIKVVGGSLKMEDLDQAVFNSPEEAESATFRKYMEDAKLGKTGPNSDCGWAGSDGPDKI
jgi:hypothetical protein